MILYLGSAQMISNVARIISGLLIAKFVVPELLGTFNGIGIIMGYLPILQLGVMNGLNRELPYYFGKGEYEKARGFASVSQSWEIILSCISFAVLLFLALFYFFKSNYLFSAGFLTYAFASIHHYLGLNYLQILFRTNQDFNKISTIALIISLVSLVSIIFVWKWNFYGLCMRNLIITTAEFYLLWRWKPLAVKPVFDLNILKEISKVGIPIFLVGLIFSLWSTIQNTFVLKMGGAEQFGLFQLALMIEASLGVVALSVSQVVYPKMAYAYGAGKKISDLLKISFKPITAVFLFFIPIIIISWIFLPYAVNGIIPKYIEGVAAGRWTLLLLLISILDVNNNLFNVLKRQKDYLISILIGILVYILVLFLFQRMHGFSLIHFPQAMFIGKLTQLAISFIFIYSYSRKSGS
jgi:O-antigen/teichoic acid export membrane protein